MVFDISANEQQQEYKYEPLPRSDLPKLSINLPTNSFHIVDAFKPGSNSPITPESNATPTIPEYNEVCKSKMFV